MGVWQPTSATVATRCLVHTYVLVEQMETGETLHLLAIVRTQHLQCFFSNCILCTFDSK